MKKCLHFIEIYATIPIVKYLFKIRVKGVFEMFVKKDEYIKPEIMIIKFGSEDIITASEGEDQENNDPWENDIF